MALHPLRLPGERRAARTAGRVPGVPIAVASTGRLLARSLGAVRLVELLPWPLALALGAGRGIDRPWLAVASYALQCGWGLWFAFDVVRRDRVRPSLAAADLAVAACCLVAAGLACAPGAATGWSNSAVAPAMGTAVALAAGLGPRRAALGGVVLAVAYLVGLARAFGAASATVAAAVGNVVSLAGFAFVGGMVIHHLFRQADAVEQAHAVAAEARERAMTERVRFEERARQYRLLHDTVLSTLTTLARGEPFDSEAVRRRCALDADRIRSLLAADGTPPTDLVAALSQVVHGDAPLGVRVQLHALDVPRIPDPVIEALCGATREALNNVARHAGTGRAWVTALGDAAGSVTVTIADQGSGFDPEGAGGGFGLERSVRQRMAEAGGAAVIDSRPGQGATVELRWPGAATG